MSEGMAHRAWPARSQRSRRGDSGLPAPAPVPGSSTAERKLSGPSMKMRLHQARLSGKLQLSSLSLGRVPDAIFSLSMSDNDNSTTQPEEVKWWTVADLTTLDLSHNSICSIPDAFEGLASSLKVSCCTLSYSYFINRILTAPQSKL